MRPSKARIFVQKTPVKSPSLGKNEPVWRIGHTAWDSAVKRKRAWHWITETLNCCAVLKITDDSRDSGVWTLKKTEKRQPKRSVSRFFSFVFWALPLHLAQKYKVPFARFRGLKNHNYSGALMKSQIWDLVQIWPQKSPNFACKSQIWYKRPKMVPKKCQFCIKCDYTVFNFKAFFAFCKFCAIFWK